jgi:ketosteroid isomerase-like protein
MPTPHETVIDLEKRFWQAIVDEDSDAATAMLCEPSFMVSTHGTFKFDHEAYRKMAAEGPMVLTSYELSDMQVAFPNENTAVLAYHVKQTMAPRGQKSGKTEEANDTSTWIKDGDGWKCVMHTETPSMAADPKARH